MLRRICLVVLVALLVCVCGEASAFSFMVPPESGMITVDAVTGDVDFSIGWVVTQLVVLIVSIVAGLGILKMTSATLTWGLNKFSRGVCDDGMYHYRGWKKDLEDSGGSDDEY